MTATVRPIRLRVEYQGMDCERLHRVGFRAMCKPHSWQGPWRTQRPLAVQDASDHNRLHRAKSGGTE